MIGAQRGPMRARLLAREFEYPFLYSDWLIKKIYICHFLGYFWPLSNGRRVLLFLTRNDKRLHLWIGISRIPNNRVDY